MLTNALMRRPAVEAVTGLSKSGLYKLINEGRFPAPRRIGTRACAWLRNDVEAWINSRPPTRSSDEGVAHPLLHGS